jgi:hypothetical protein
MLKRNKKLKKKKRRNQLQQPQQRYKHLNQVPLLFLAIGKQVAQRKVSEQPKSIQIFLLISIWMMKNLKSYNKKKRNQKKTGY